MNAIFKNEMVDMFLKTAKMQIFPTAFYIDLWRIFNWFCLMWHAYLISYDLNSSIGKVDLIFTGSIIVFSVFSVREYGSVGGIVHGIFEIVYWRCDGFCGIGCGSWVVRKGWGCGNGKKKGKKEDLKGFWKFGRILKFW